MKRHGHSFFLLFVLHGLAAGSAAGRIALNVNLKRPIAVTDERFLSLTVDPATLLAGNALSKDFERSVNLAKAMSPAYIRLGGPRTCLRHFAHQDSEGIEEKRGVLLTESDWVLAHQWAEKAGLDVIACISPDNRQRGSEQSEDATEIISFSDHMGFNASWQLGYECQTKCDLSAGDLAKQTLHLRKVLNEFPRYSSSIITGPDVLIYDSEQQRKYLRDYFAIAAPALSAITWHPDFASVTLDNAGAFVHRDSLEEDKEELFKVIGPFVEDQSLWIAESRPEECKNLFIGALVLTRRLGNAARANVKVAMRQPTNLAWPTPDYWVSLLHKTLVGREVFDASSEVSNERHVYLYCQCARASEWHGKGSIVVFGLNLSPEDVAINLETINVTTAHEYILSPGFDASNRMFAESVFFNDKLLTLINDTIPDIHPVVLTDASGLDLRLQSGHVGFWVIPDAKVNSCMSEGASKGRTWRVRDPRSLAEDVKARVTRGSAQDRASVKDDRRWQRSLGLIERELRKLKKFVGKQLDDHESRSLLSIRGLSSSEDANGKNWTRPRDDLRNRLQEFKERLARLADSAESNGARSRKSIDELAANVVPLVLKALTDLEPVKEESNYENRMKSSGSVKETLKTLYELLVHTNLGESIDSKEDRVNEGSKRSKRDLLGEIGQPLNSKRESLSREAPETDNFEGVRAERKIKWWENIRKRMQPTIVELDSTESGGNVFNVDSTEDLPKGDVFFLALDPPKLANQDYEYAEDFGPRDRRIDGTGRKQPSEVDYISADDFNPRDRRIDGTGRKQPSEVDYISADDFNPRDPRIDGTGRKQPSEVDYISADDFGRKDRRIDGTGRKQPSEVDYIGADDFGPRDRRIDGTGRKQPSEVDYIGADDFGPRDRRIDGTGRKQPSEVDYISADDFNPRDPRIDGTGRKQPSEVDYISADDFGRKDRRIDGTGRKQPSEVDYIGADDFGPRDRRIDGTGRKQPSEVDYISADDFGPRDRRIDGSVRKQPSEVDYIGADDFGPRDRRIDGTGRKQPSEVDYTDADSGWADVEDDYSFYEPVEFLGNSRSWNNRMEPNSKSPGRRWEAKIYGSRKNDRFGDEKEFKIVGIGTDAKPEIQDDKSSSGRLDGYYESSSLLKNHRPTYRTFMPDESVAGSGLSRQPPAERINYDNWKASGYGPSPPLKGLDFSIGADYHDSRRPKRGNTDLHAILDQEMINEDDANSKDCNCRVIRQSKTCNCRSKRDAIESMESQGGAGAVLKEEVIADLNKDIARSELRDDTDVEIFAELKDSPMEKLQLQSRSSQPKIVQNAGRRANSGDLGKDRRGSKRARNRFESDIPTLESRSDYQSAARPTNLPSTLNSREPANLSSGQTSMTSIRPAEDNSFNPDKEEKQGIFSSTQRAWTDRENSTPCVDEKLAAERGMTEKAEEASASRAESSSTTAQTTETISKEFDKNYDNPATVSSKRQTMELVSLKRPVAIKIAKPAQSSVARRRNKGRIHVTKPHDPVISKRLRTLLSLKDLLRKYSASHSAAAKLKTANKTEEYRRNRAKQVKTLQDKLHQKRETMLRECEKSIHDVVGQETNPEKRSLKRREAWEAMKESEDFRDMLNREKLAYILMYQPTKYDSKRQVDESDELTERVEVPITEVVRVKNVRERVFDPRTQKQHRDATIIEHPDPSRLREKIIKLTNLYQPTKYDSKRQVDESDELTERVKVPITEVVRVKNVRERVFDPRTQKHHRDATIIEHPDPSRLKEKIIKLTNLYQGETPKRSNDERRDRTYFALVEDVERPRIFYYDQGYSTTGDEPRTNMRAASLFHDATYNQLRRKPYHGSLKAAQYSSEEDQEESDELPEGKEIYIIDPSEYKGGDPHLRLYGGPRRSGINRRIASQDTYQAILEPVPYVPYKIRETWQRSREGKAVGQDSAGLSRHTGKLLKILVDNLDAHTAEELFQKLTGQRAAGSEKQNSPRSIGEVEEEREEDATEVGEDGELEEISASEEDPDRSESSDTRGSAEQRGCYRGAATEEESETGQDDISGTLIPRENTTNTPIEDSEGVDAEYARRRKDASAGSKEYLGPVPSFFPRKPPVEETEVNDYSRLEPSPEAASRENPSEQVQGTNEYSTETFDPKFLIPSTSVSPGSSASGHGVGYSPIEADLRAKDLRGKPAERYEDRFNSAEKGSQAGKTGELSGDDSRDRRDQSVSEAREVSNAENDERRKRSNGNADLKVLPFNEAETLIALPWGSSRLRREAGDEKIGEYGNANEVQSSDMQRLDEPSSPKIPAFSRMDDVEKSLIRKVSREKFATGEDAREKKKDEGFSYLLDRSVPKLENVVLEGLGKAENFGESVARLIEDMDEKYNETLREDAGGNVTCTSSRSTSPTRNIFCSAITNVKKFFMLFNGITNLLRG